MLSLISLILIGITIGLSILAAIMTGLNTMLLIYGRDANFNDLIGFTIIGITFFALHSLSKDNDAPRMRVAWVLNIILFIFTGFLPFVFTSGVGIIEIDPFSNNLMYGFLFFLFALILLIAHKGHAFLMDSWQKFGLSFLIAEFSFNTVMHFMGNYFLFFPIAKRLFILGITLVLSLPLILFCLHESPVKSSIEFEDADDEEDEASAITLKKVMTLYHAYENMRDEMMGLGYTSKTDPDLFARITNIFSEADYALNITGGQKGIDDAYYALNRPFMDIHGYYEIVKAKKREEAYERANARQKQEEERRQQETKRDEKKVDASSDKYSIDFDAILNGNPASGCWGSSPLKDALEESAKLFAVDLSSFKGKSVNDCEAILKKKRALLVKLYHPDENGGANMKQAQAVNKAYDVLVQYVNAGFCNG